MKINNFVYYNPTKIYFGDQQLSHLAEEVKKHGDKALLVYGGGSIRKNGLYDRIMSILSGAGIETAECSGIEPNPQYTSVNRAAKICRDAGCQVVIAVGGGSVIDASKVVAQAAFYEGDCWDLVTKKVDEPRALPLIAVPTMASAGSENDAWAVISNADTNEKLDPWHAGYQPTAAFIDPSITYTVSPYQTAVGAADIFSHIVEIRYFLKDHKIEFVSEMMEVMAANTVKYGAIAVKDPNNMEARQNLSWLSAMITGGIMDMGGIQDMALHMTEYGIAAFYEIPHGHGIAILFPRWMQYVLSEETAPVFYHFGQKCFGIPAGLEDTEGAQKTIDALSHWLYEEMGLESRLSAFGVTEDRLHDMAVKATGNHGGILHSITDLTTDDVEHIFKMCL